MPLEGDGGLISDDLVDIHGTRFWDAMSEADRVDLNRRVTRWRLSTLVAGEHGAMLLCSQLVNNVQGQDAKLFQATQVADRFHLLQNLAEALDQVFGAHGNALNAVSDGRRRTPVVQPDGQTAVPVPPSAPTPQAQTRAAQRRARRLAIYEQVWSLQRQGWSPRLIAQHLGLGRMTVVRDSPGADLSRAQSPE